MASASCVLPSAKTGIRMQPPRLKARSIASARRRSSAARVKPSGNGAVAPRRLDDQDIHTRLRKNGAFGDRLVVEVYIAAVEDRAAFRAQDHAGRAQDVAGIDELDRERRQPRAASRARLPP